MGAPIINFLRETIIKKKEKSYKLILYLVKQCLDI